MPNAHLQAIAEELDADLEHLDKDRVIERTWSKDHTLWDPEPDEITNRLGWLDLVREPPAGDDEVRRLVAEVRSAGIRDTVLIGMGGSSLGAEALRASFGDTGEGRLHVLDSIHPDWVRRVRREIDPASTLFLVASKSGTTAEVMSLYGYFRREVEEALGADAAGAHFVAVTDPGTPLVSLAGEQGFRAVFTNPPDIGGRFSVLSRFGLVAAALAGIDGDRLLRRAHRMASRCLPGTAAAENPGVWLGAVLGAAARSGRDQMTLLTSSRIASFGLWVEQLIAESTGKEGLGILPVTGEPDAEVLDRHPRRLFVVVRYRPEPDAELDARVERLKAAGQPVVEYELEDLYDLAGEFFRWQLATAVAGHLVGIHPFDQPDVESAKREARRLLAAYESTGELPAVAAESDLFGALGSGLAPAYVAFMAYADEDRELETAVGELRRRLLSDHGLTTTFGYGPRFLHSTGQLHKGGPDGGLFVQLVSGAGDDLVVPGSSYGLGVLLQAQAAGDLAALQGRGRRCVRLELGREPATALRRQTRAAVAAWS